MKGKRRHTANELSTALKRLQRGIAHNQVRLDKARWCAVCSISKAQSNGRFKMYGHTTKYKGETCDVISLCDAAVNPCFRIYHNGEILEHVPRQSRSYSLKSIELKRSEQ